MKKDAEVTYEKEILVNLVNKDTDEDGVLDWEEKLWGTDPAKKDTDNDGILDSTEIEKLKLAKTKESDKNKNTKNTEENTTATDKFSQELFSTIATLSQDGQIDQTTADKLSSSLAEQIKNSGQRKVFTIADIKIIKSDVVGDTKSYQTALGALFRKHVIYTSVSDVLAESMKKNGDIDVKVLNKLDPVIKDFQGIVEGMHTMSVPESLSILHLQTMNSFQKVMENIKNMKLVDVDTVLAIGAISQYEQNDEELRVTIEKLITAINNKLNN